MELYDSLIKENDKEALKEYLEGRSIHNVPEDFFWCKGVYSKGHQYSGLFVVVKDTYGNIQQISNRNNKWSIVYTTECSIPIWREKDIHKSDTIIITESAIDAESVRDLLPENISIVSTMSASFKLSQFHYLIYLAYNKHIVLAFDNDNGGQSSTERFIKMAKDKYGKEIHTLSYAYKDLNEFVNKAKNANGILKTNLRSILK